MKGKALKKLLSGALALTMTASAFAGLSITASAANITTITPKMTYVDKNNAATAMGYVDSARSGYHSGSGLGFGRESWGENKTAYLKIDASQITDSIIASATLSLDVSGSSDSKRNTTYGLVYFENTDWDETLTYNSAVSKGIHSDKGTAIGGTYSTKTKSATVFETAKFDITSALENKRAITIAIYETAAAGGYIKNPSLVIESANSNVYTVNYNVDGNVTTDSVLDGEFVNETNIPETAKTGYIFKGWTKDSDTSKVYSTDEVKAMAITADTTFTAVYEKDADYIEPMTAVEFATYPADGKLAAGADANTAASNPISVKIIGELGTDLMQNPDSRVDDIDVKYELNGFRWIADKKEASTDSEGSSVYCDSYGNLIVNDDHSADFQLRSHPFNYYGSVTATVTYNGKTMSVTKPLVYIGNPNANAGKILPRAGYYSDINAYAPDMVGYETATSPDNKGATDIVTDNWAAYGGNVKTVTIQEENGKRFLRLEAFDKISSSFAANQIEAVADTQVVFDQMVRFHTANSSIILKTDNPVTWKDASTTFSADFNGSAISLNGSKIADVTTGVWYHIVITSDVTSGKCYGVVYNENGEKLGESEIVDFSQAGSINPTYYMFRTPDRAPGKLDFNDVKITRATIDSASFNTTTTSETIAIPEAGEEAQTATIAVSAKTTDGLPVIGKATWEVADETITGVTITPSQNDTHEATVTVEAGATAGELPIDVTIGGSKTRINLTLTSSKDSVKFTESSAGVSIPLSESKKAVANYKAVVVDGSGNEIAGKEMAYALYDAKNASPISAPAGTTFENGVLTVTSAAKACTVYVRAISTNSNGEVITKAVKVDIHGLSFDFGAGTDEDVADGYTPVTPKSVYSAAAGYGIEGTAAAGGEASLDNAASDYLEGSYTFKANVEKNKLYTVKITYQGSLTSEYVNSDLAGVSLSNAPMSEVTYTIPVFDDVLDLAVSSCTYKVVVGKDENNKDIEEIRVADPRIASISIEQQSDKTPGAKPHIYTVGDSTIANNGSWAYVLNRDQSNYPELTELASFSNNGRGGKNLGSYYTGGEFRDRVLNNVRPDDYVMIGCMGTNGMGSYYETDLNYYIDACLTLGAKVILYSYTPHFAVSNYSNCYNAQTHTFTGYRQDSYDNIVRRLYEERKDELAGFVEIGKNADASFNAYVTDYANNGYESADAAAQAIIACAGSRPGEPDHNHYSNGTIACQLMLNGYGDGKGIVAQLVDLLSESDEHTWTEYDVTYNANGTLGSVSAKQITNPSSVTTSRTDDSATFVWNELMQPYTK